VVVVLCAPVARVHGDARTHFDAARKTEGVEILDGTSDDAVYEAAASTVDAQVVVDALFGTGLQREVTGHFAGAIAAINAHAGLVVAVDVPSGLDADRGVSLGACVRAQHTVTFGFLKRGLVGAPGFVQAGDVHVADIGIPERLAEARGVRGRLLDDGVLAPLIDLDPQAHKGTHGHLVLLAGSAGKLGAALLAGRSALRAGAGLVTVAVPEALPDVGTYVNELMTARYGAGSSPESLLEGKKALAAGPGMPTSPEGRRFLGALLAAAQARTLPLVIDADALNHLAEEPTLLPAGDPGTRVLTPHPGEAARLLGKTAAEVQQDRFGAAQALARAFSAVVALKGARTVVAAPDGRVAVCPTGNPGMGTGGTGDVLTGCIGALLAGGLDAWTAACAGVYWHGAAGDLAAADIGVRGLTAGDVAEALPRVLTKWQAAVAAT
jgi:NAD(P)H-hydrate epimerase